MCTFKSVPERLICLDISVQENFGKAGFLKKLFCRKHPWIDFPEEQPCLRERHNLYQMISAELFFYFFPGEIFSGNWDCSLHHRNHRDDFVSISNIESEKETRWDHPEKKPSPVPRPRPPAIPTLFGQWLMPVNVFKISLEIVRIPRITPQNASPEQRV
jgi:hypothetical protein